MQSKGYLLPKQLKRIPIRSASASYLTKPHTKGYPFFVSY